MFLIAKIDYSSLKLKFYFIAQFEIKKTNMFWGQKPFFLFIHKAHKLFILSHCTLHICYVFFKKPYIMAGFEPGRCDFFNLMKSPHCKRCCSRSRQGLQLKPAAISFSRPRSQFFLHENNLLIFFQFRTEKYPTIIN
jgi:hypothetical protein